MFASHLINSGLCYIGILFSKGGILALGNIVIIFCLRHLVMDGNKGLWCWQGWLTLLKGSEFAAEWESTLEAQEYLRDLLILVYASVSGSNSQ